MLTWPTQLLPALALACLTLVRPLTAAEVEHPSASPFEGTWQWTFTMPDGAISRPKLTLFTRDGGIAGRTSFRPGTEVPVTNIVIQGPEIRYQVVRHRLNQDVVTTYSGKLADGIIQGTIESLGSGGEKRVFDWEARRLTHSLTGTWRWTNNFFQAGSGGRRGFDSRVELKQDGTSVTGQTISRFGRPTSITQGTFTNGVVYFEIDRLIFDVRSYIKYRGKLEGEVIHGTMESEVEGEDRVIDWHAIRQE